MCGMCGMRDPVWFAVVGCSKSGSGRWPSADEEGKVAQAWSVSFCNSGSSGPHAQSSALVRTSVPSQTYVHFGRANRARVHVVWCIWINKDCVWWSEMSGAGVASRPAEPRPSDLPLRFYVRALRQYQKLLDIKRISTKDKVRLQASHLLPTRLVVENYIMHIFLSRWLLCNCSQ